MTDLKATIQMNLDFIIFRIYRFVAPQERIAARLGKTRDIIRSHLGKGFTMPHLVEKHGWPAPMMLGLENPDPTRSN